MSINKLLLIISFPLFLFFSRSLNAQLISVHHPQLQFLFEDSLLQNTQYHSAFLPFKISVEQLNRSLGGRNFNNKSISLSPVLESSAGFVQNNKDLTYQFGQGAYAAGDIGNKVGFELSAVFYEQKFSGENYSLDTLKLVPRYNRYVWAGKERADYISIRGNMYWKANKWLTFTAGNDKFFMGDGKRSLLLSENAAAYPFFQTRLNIWKINYFHQIMLLQDVVPGLKDRRFDKYASMHALSLNATKKLNLYVFEAVIWRKQDSIRQRGVDLNYLNPFLFFRPVEFNMGSPDNVLMGVGGKWILGNHTMFYGQLMLDEFKLKEIKANKGWWANKYAFQTGFKTYSLLRKYKSVFQIEYNQSRPFTYAHTNSLENYGYLNESLAHPQGSNFRELVSDLKMQYRKHWIISVSGQYLVYGTDIPGTNYGSDIYKSQWTFTNKYGNVIGQGIKNTFISGDLTINRVLIPSWRLAAFSTFHLALHEVHTVKDWQPSVQLGLTTLLYE